MNSQQRQNSESNKRINYKNQSGGRRTNGAHPNAQYRGQSFSANPASDLRNNLSSQTPLNRRLNRTNKKHDPGTKRRDNKTQYFRIKEDRKAERKYLKRRIVAVLVVYVIFMLLSVTGFAIWLPTHKSPETHNYVYQIGDKKNIISKKVYSYKTVKVGDVFYLDMMGIADYCNLIITGDSESLKLTVEKTGEYITFSVDESTAIINGTPERAEAVSFVRNGKLYAPLDFVKRCFNGLNVDLDNENYKITITRDMDKTGSYVLISFPYKDIKNTEPIEFSSLSEDLRNEINSRAEDMTEPQAEASESEE